MGKKIIDRLTAELGSAIVETLEFRGDHEARVAKKDWKKLALFLRHDLDMNHFIELTAVDYPEREPSGPRFEVKLIVRSMKSGHRIRVSTRVGDGEELATLCDVWRGANWAEREIWDMFGIPFTDHPDLRRILMYEEFVGHPLRKDYPIDRVQPLVAYREVDGTDKLPPFGADEGQPFGRIDWAARLAGGDVHVSPSISEQTGGRKALSRGPEHDSNEAAPTEAE